MNNPDKERKDVEALLREQRLHDAISRLRILSPANDWSITSELDRAEQDYRLMLKYAFASGGPDPERARLHADISRRLHAVLLAIVRRSLAIDSPSLYFSTLRYERTRHSDSIASLIADYRSGLGASSLFARTTGMANDKAFTPDERERRERRLFNRVWTTTPLSAEDAAAIGSLWDDPSMPDRLPAMIVGALLLGSLEYPDDEALRLLLDAAIRGSSTRLKLRAATAALIIIGINNDRQLPRSVTSRLQTLAEDPDWIHTVRLVWSHFINAKITERIDGKFRDEVLPAMMKLRDNMPDPSNFADPEALLEQNPEWESLFEKSGINKKLRELSEMQAQGADLNHSTFGMLKAYPFFNEVANWFMPFDPDHSDMVNALKNKTQIADLLAVSPFMCDNDKFSLLLSLNHIPTSQSDMLISQMGAHSDQMARLASEELLAGEKQRENIVNKFMQDLYRFFSHFRRKDEFNNPFDNMLDLSNVLTGTEADAETMRTVAELCFKYGYYDESIALFNRVKADPVILQKKGYALQQTGRLHEALTAFERSELMDADNIYTLRRIASLHRRLGHPARALDYFRRIQTLKPDDIASVLSEGHCQLDLGKYHDALHCYYRAEFMDETSIKPLRPIAWVSLLMKDFDTSRNYYERLMSSTTPTPEDYLNMGHLQLACGNPREALNLYKLFSEGKSPEDLRAALDADRPMLAEAGIDTSIIPLIIDSILYA